MFSLKKDETLSHIIKNTVSDREWVVIIKEEIFENYVKIKEEIKISRILTILPTSFVGQDILGYMSDPVSTVTLK